jgi:predicted outer membrane lipoprotein
MAKGADEVTSADPNPFVAGPPEPGPVWDDILLRLALAAAFGMAAALAYYLTQRKRRAEAASFVATMVLLSVLLGMVSMVIGSNIARAFALVGALSIVRFRTVVEDTRDTAFVIFAVVVGMAAGAGAYLVAAVGIPIVGLVAWLLAIWGRSGERNGTAREKPTTVVVRLGIGVDPAAGVAVVLEKHAEGAQLVEVATVRQGTAIDLTYLLRLRPGTAVLALVGDLNRTEGVQGVEWKSNAERGGELPG